MSQKLYTMEEAAQELRISKRSLYNMVLGHHPEIRSIKIGYRRLIPEQCLDEYILDRLEQAG